MTIEKKEILILSKTEDKAMDETVHILEGIWREATDPHLRDAANTALKAIYEIWDHLPDGEE